MFGLLSTRILIFWQVEREAFVVIPVVFLFPTFLTSTKNCAGCWSRVNIYETGSKRQEHHLQSEQWNALALQGTPSSHICYENIPFGDEYSILLILIQNQLLVFDNNKLPDTVLSQEWVSSVFTTNYFILMALK